MSRQEIEAEIERLLRQKEATEAALRSIDSYIAELRKQL